MKNGKVWLVGSGPSDVGLFTLKGKEVLEQAEVVVYDKLVGQGILALMPENAEKINVGKIAGHHLVPQEKINQILLKKALEGKRVVRLKGGDPFLFGRGGEELELLVEHKIAFEVIPGITSALSVPAYQGIPVTHRDFCSSLHIITAHKKSGTENSIDYSKLVNLDGTLIFLMGVSALEEICSGLIKAGMNPAMPAAILEKGTTAKQRRIVAQLNELGEKARKSEISTPAIIIVGQVCQLADKFHWAEDRPLGGARVVVTRPKRVASKLIQKLNEMGAEVIALPSIKTVPIENNQPLNKVFETVSHYEWVVFTSETAVEIFFQTMMESGKDIRCASNLKFAVVGPATEQALHKRGIKADYIPEKYYGKELGIGLAASINLKRTEDNEMFVLEPMRESKKVLLMTPKGVESDCEKGLQEEGIIYEKVECYETLDIKGEQIEIEEGDYVAFTSASTVRGFMNRVSPSPDSLKGIKAICIGKQTAIAAEQYGFEINIAEKPSIDALVDKIIELHKTSKIALKK